MTPLTELQLEMAWSIAQYDVKSASRYCVYAQAMNDLKCPICGSELIKRGSFADNFLCPNSQRRKHGK
ncbi:MAG: hypothetical protein KME54_23330 [Tolypothrix brevis GSE-NOS-MK-07-07A]|jgi:predicted RNA-binding Zn-ribbon protein involved in translation (DUF1610 family)|nr:hypothetical protein [Tolypothrix brevis GSE-NOS-MK-07-07A]